MLQCYLIPEYPPSYYTAQESIQKSHKECSTCGNSTHLSHFRRGRNQCRFCEAEYKHFKRYGITKTTYDNYYQEQQGCCAICKQPETARTPFGFTRKLCVDHNHETLEVRGLLCHACNTLIGLSGEDFTRLLKAATYIVNQTRVW